MTTVIERAASVMRNSLHRFWRAQQDLAPTIDRCQLPTRTKA